jgi:hypothetical protein
MPGVSFPALGIYTRGLRPGRWWSFYGLLVAPGGQGGDVQDASGIREEVARGGWVHGRKRSRFAGASGQHLQG